MDLAKFMNETMKFEFGGWRPKMACEMSLDLVRTHVKTSSIQYSHIKIENFE